MASTWLMEQGYDVFRNVSPHGLIDLVAIQDSRVLRLDVKLKSEVPIGSGAHGLSEMQVLAGVKLLAVCEDGRCEIITPAPIRLGDFSRKD
jgi:hypothetical protein